MRPFILYAQFVRKHRISKVSRRFWMKRLLYLHSQGYEMSDLLRMTVL